MLLPILFCRENRIRAYLGVRYDHRNGVFDWDYNMKFLDLVSIISCT